MPESLSQPGPIAFDDHLLGEHAHYPRSSRYRGQAPLSLNLTAMIDVVFQMLIYFLVATEFKSGEEIYRMDLPQRLPAQAQRDPFDLDRQPLRLSVATMGPGRDAARLGIEGPYPQPASFDELLDFLRRRRVGPDSPTGLFEPDHPIVIVPTPSTRWEHAVGVFNAAARARYENITLAKPR
jgi:biopolymer transport protein ExbD